MSEKHSFSTRNYVSRREPILVNIKKWISIGINNLERETQFLDGKHSFSNFVSRNKGTRTRNTVSRARYYVSRRETMYTVSGNLVSRRETGFLVRDQGFRVEKPGISCEKPSFSTRNLVSRKTMILVPGRVLHIFRNHLQYYIYRSSQAFKKKTHECMKQYDAI